MMTTSLDDAGYYRVLNVVSTASEAEIRKAFHVLARALHPDKNVGDMEAVARLQAVGEAWSVLRHRHLRKVYDREGKAGLEDVSDVAESDSDADEGEEDEGDATEDDDHDINQALQPSMLSAFFSAPGLVPPDASSSAQPSKAKAEEEPSFAQPSKPKAEEEPSIDRQVALQIAAAVAEAIRRTEESAAARYEQALASVLQSLDPSLMEINAKERARRAWAEAGISKE